MIWVGFVGGVIVGIALVYLWASWYFKDMFR